MEDSGTERTFVAIKPDGVLRGFVGEIFKRFERRGFRLVAARLLWASKELLCDHYKDLSGTSYFDSLVENMNSGPIFAMVWEGRGIVKSGRRMLGVTDPCSSDVGTIRGDLCIDIKRTACHASDSVEAAQREITLWFRQEELADYSLTNKQWTHV